MSFTLPAPRVESLPCQEGACDGFYQPYSDGSLSCYQGHRSSLSVDDVEVSGLTLVFDLSEC